jgi:sialidase-1
MIASVLFEQQDIFISDLHQHYRIPSLCVSPDGSILAFANRRLDTPADSAVEVHIVTRLSPDGGKTWDSIDDIFALAGWHAAMGTAISDSENGTIILPYNRNARQNSDLARAETKAAESGNFLAISRDNGHAWRHVKMVLAPNSAGCCGSTHGASPGIKLIQGSLKGRLIAPARFATQPDEKLSTLQKHHYNCTVYSDDLGETWQTGGPVQVGTGEGCIVELSDGTIYYNSRAYFMDGKRRIARSYDGGETFDDFAVDETLIEPDGGCSAGMAKYPGNQSEDRDIIIFSNPASSSREKLTVRLSCDGGRSWPVSKVIHEGPAAYSSMAIARDGNIFVLYENGDENPYERISIARFNLAWLTN